MTGSRRAFPACWLLVLFDRVSGVDPPTLRSAWVDAKWWLDGINVLVEEEA